MLIFTRYLYNNHAVHGHNNHGQQATAFYTFICIHRIVNRGTENMQSYNEEENHLLTQLCKDNKAIICGEEQRLCLEQG